MTPDPSDLPCADRRLYGMTHSEAQAVAQIHKMRTDHDVEVVADPTAALNTTIAIYSSFTSWVLRCYGTAGFPTQPAV